MIYHNYSPYYYGSSPKTNRKNMNNNPARIPTSYTNKNYKKYYTTESYDINNKYSKTEYKKNIPYNTQYINTQKKIPPKSNNDVIFEIFGIKLYFDDILLICLIFFLYNEGVQDQYLFIALVLLLLS